jgi:hypothetical protein
MTPSHRPLHLSERLQLAHGTSERLHTERKNQIICPRECVHRGLPRTFGK